MKLKTFKDFVNSIDTTLDDYDVVLQPNYYVNNPRTLEVKTTKYHRTNEDTVQLRLVDESARE